MQGDRHYHEQQPGRMLAATHRNGKSFKNKGGAAFPYMSRVKKRTEDRCQSDTWTVSALLGSAADRSKLREYKRFILKGTRTCVVLM